MTMPANPTVVGLEPYEIVFGEGQPGIIPLHTLRTHQGVVISRWELDEQDRKNIINGADVFVFMHTYFGPPMPIDVQVGGKHANNDDMLLVHGLNDELTRRIKDGSAMEPLPMLQAKCPSALDTPEKFATAGEYQHAEHQLALEHSQRAPEQAEMDFAEWQVAEILRLRRLVIHLARNL